MTCEGGRRAVTLRWDAATFQLVPLREGLPTFTGTWVCRQDWETDNGG